MTMSIPAATAPLQPSDIDRVTRASRYWLLGATLALAACSSTPLPPWPVSGTTGAASLSTNPTTPATPDTAAVATTSPIAPAAQLEALPYSGAIGQWFPAPAHQYQTPGLVQPTPGLTSNAALERTLTQLAQQHLQSPVRIGVLKSGSSQQSQPLLTVVATRAPAISPLALDESGRPNVLVVAGQQGTDGAATEAVLVLAQELTPGGLLTPLLDKINVILVPRANPDGFEQGTASTANGTDLRYDHLQLSTPEARFLAKLVRDYRPAVLLDAGEFPAMDSTADSLGAVRASDMGLQYTLTPNSNEFIAKAAREWLHLPVAQALQAAALRADWAAHAVNTSTGAGYAMDTLAPTTLINTAGLKNVTALHLQSRGSDLQATHLQRRVDSHVQSMTAALQSAAQRADDLRKVQSFVARDVASHACRGTLVVHAQPSAQSKVVPLLERSSAQLLPTAVPWISSLEPSSRHTRMHACGYWLSANAVQAGERLSMMGVQVQRVAELAPLQAQTYESSILETATNSQQQIDTARSTMEAVPGSFYVSMNQPLAFLAAAALEPDSPYSFYRNDILSLGDIARIVLTPNLVFEDE